MKVSISLPVDDLNFVDAETEAGRFDSRSAVVHAAIRLLRDRRHIDSYAAAWDEWDLDNGQVWESLNGDGVA
jgi:putative addiction module CopG family antidote